MPLTDTAVPFAKQGQITTRKQLKTKMGGKQKQNAKYWAKRETLGKRNQKTKNIYNTATIKKQEQKQKAGTILNATEQYTAHTHTHTRSKRTTINTHTHTHTHAHTQSKRTTIKTQLLEA